jgi:hypothetical protein
MNFGLDVMPAVAGHIQILSPGLLVPGIVTRALIAHESRQTSKLTSAKVSTKLWLPRGLGTRPTYTRRFMFANPVLDARCEDARYHFVIFSRTNFRNRGELLKEEYDTPSKRYIQRTKL